MVICGKDHSYSRKFTELLKAFLFKIFILKHFDFTQFLLGLELVLSGIRGATSRNGFSYVSCDYPDRFLSVLRWQGDRRMNQNQMAEENFHVVIPGDTVLTMI